MSGVPAAPPDGLGRRLSARWGLDLPVERVRDRLSAYVYGNILVLSAIATTTPHQAEDGHGALVVLATTGTTYLAHVLAHLVGGAVGRDADAGPPGEAAHELRHELRDAVPILSSGSLPALVLGLAWLVDVSGELALVLAAAVVVLRLASLGVTVGRLSGLPPTRRQVWAGLAVAVLGVVVVVLKTTLLH